MRFIIPARTALDTTDDIHRRNWRRHTLRRSLVVGEPERSIGGEMTFVYRDWLLRVDRLKVCRLREDCTYVYSLIFSLATPPPEISDLVVPLDEYAEAEFTRPADPAKTLLDIWAGDAVVHRGRPERASRVAPVLTSATFR